jgi:hypothetical protein
MEEDDDDQMSTVRARRIPPPPQWWVGSMPRACMRAHTLEQPAFSAGGGDGGSFLFRRGAAAAAAEVLSASPGALGWVGLSALPPDACAWCAGTSCFCSATLPPSTIPQRLPPRSVLW